MDDIYRRARRYTVGRTVLDGLAALFLASDMSRHVSGVAIYVDGGASLLR